MADTEVITVPMEVEYRGAWLTWVAATTTCLSALGVDCDQTDVAGITGYAFMLCIHKELCPSGPTVFDWGSLIPGVHYLGRSTLSYGSSDGHFGDYRNERTRAHCRFVFEAIKREVGAGRPCVLWGAYVPEFSVVVGIEGDSYQMCSFKRSCDQDEPPVAWDDLEAPGGSYMMAFPTVTDIPSKQLNADRMAIGRAVQLLTQHSMWSDYSYGIAAYDSWINAIESNIELPFGNAYCAQCYSERTGFAHGFLERVLVRHPEMATTLEGAVAAYAKAVPAMKRVAEIFPFPGEKRVEDSKLRDEAIGALRDAKAAEAVALESLEKAVETWPKTIAASQDM